MIVPVDVIEVLRDCSIEGNQLLLPPEQLDRKLYQKVDKILGILGGMWDTRQKAHVFEANPSADVQDAIETGEVVDEKTEFQYFPTPMELASQLCWEGFWQLSEKTTAQDTIRILEPSAGSGGLVRALLNESCALGYEESDLLIDCVEMNPKLARKLKEQGFNVVADDFLQYHPGPVYDLVLANPPFSNCQDVIHFEHMLECVKPGGAVASIMSNGIKYRSDKRTKQLRSRLESMGARIIDNPGDSFKESGTNVSTITVAVRIPDVLEEIEPAIGETLPEEQAVLALF